MKNANFKKLLCFLFIIPSLLLIAVSCGRLKDFNSNISESFSFQPEEQNSELKAVTTTSSSNSSQTENNAGLIFFDYKKIKKDVTTSIGVKIKNTNVFPDYFGNLCVLGEIINVSNSAKTNILLTIDFLDKKGDNLHSDKISINANYLRPESKIPFAYMLSDHKKYIDVHTIKIGADYDDYYKLLKSNIIVNKENFSYKNDILKINGKIVNIGENKAININLLSTFYDVCDRVVSIRKCFIKKDELLPKEEQNFAIDVLFSKYTKNFTHYDFEVFFEDSVEMP